MTDDAAAALAERVAKALARKWGQSWRWREHLSGAWLGVRRARAAGVAGRVLFAAAARGAVDALRAETGHRRVRRVAVGLPVEPAREDEDRAAAADEFGALLRVLPRRSRRLMELIYRDGLLQREAGAVLGLSESRVSQLRAEALAILRGTDRAARLRELERVRLRSRAWRAANPVRARDLSREAAARWRAAVPGRKAAYLRGWRAANPGRDAGYSRAYRAAHRAGVNAGQAARKAARYAADPAFRAAEAERQRLYRERKKAEREAAKANGGAG